MYTMTYKQQIGSGNLHHEGGSFDRRREGGGGGGERTVVAERERDGVTDLEAMNIEPDKVSE